MKQSLVKTGGTCRSPKSYNLCLECLRLPEVKLLWQRFCQSGRRGPGNETLKKRKEQTAFYDRFQPSAGPGNQLNLLSFDNVAWEMWCYVPNAIKLSAWQSSRPTCINIFAQSSHGKSVTNAIEFSRLAVPFKSTALASAWTTKLSFSSSDQFSTLLGIHGGKPL